MKQTILLTGATDGLGALAAEMLSAQGHNLILSGRRQDRLDQMVTALSPQSSITSYCCDLSSLADVARMTDEIVASQSQLDVIINNAGVLKADETKTSEGLELRFAVNTIAPYLLTRRLLPLLRDGGRVVNLSSAAQRPIDPCILGTYQVMSDMAAYAQSKLAITAWTRQMALTDPAHIYVAVNPASLLGTKMVKQGFGIDGADIRTGADIICRAATDEAFAQATGLYFDNDEVRFADPHEDALSDEIGQAIIAEMTRIIDQLI